MAHPYKSEAKSGHAKKLAGYGAKSSAKNWAGDSALNTDKQAGMEIIEEEPSMSKKTMDRIMRKAGGAVKGKEAAKRLDKGSRKGKRMKAADGLPPIDEQLKSAERLGEIRARKMPEEGPTREEAESINRTHRYSVEDLAAPRRKKGGKVSEMEWEHSKKDLSEDRKLAKKYGMPLEKWEKSKLDEKHDKQQSMEGLKKGGRACRGSGGPVAPKTKIYNSSENNVTKSARSGVRMGALTEAAKTTDRVKKFGGGGLSDDGTKGKKSSRATNLTINIGNPGQDQSGMPQAMARPMPQAPAMPPAAPPMPAPMPAGGPMGGMPPMGPMAGGMPPMGGAPMMRKKGGRVAKWGGGGFGGWQSAPQTMTPQTQQSAYQAMQNYMGQMNPQSWQGMPQTAQPYAQQDVMRSLGAQQPQMSLDQIYQNALGRAPDEAGRQFWSQQAANGMSMQDIQNAIAHSAESMPRAVGTNPYTGQAWGQQPSSAPTAGGQFNPALLGNLLGTISGFGGGQPMARKKGGRVRTTDDLTAGAGSGEGRLEKVELQQSMKGKRP